MSDAVMTADFIDRWLTRPILAPAWGWTHPGEDAPGERKPLPRGKHRAAPYPASYAMRKDDRLHWLYLRCVGDQQEARARGEPRKTWRDCLAEIGIRNSQDVKDYFARREVLGD